MTPHEVLIAAKALIDTPEKWSHGVPYGSRGDICAVLALNAICDPLPFPKSRVWMDAYDALLSQMPDGPWVRVSMFNDAPGTTHADIMALYDRAIAATAPKSEADS